MKIKNIQIHAYVLFLKGFYGISQLPFGYTTFNRKADETSPIESSYFPLSMFVLMGFGNAVGVVSVPWMLMSELFPFKYVNCKHFKNP